MTEQQYRVVADRDKGDDPRDVEQRPGDRLIYSETVGAVLEGPVLVRIERPVPTTDSRSQMERESDALDALRATPVPVPHPPTREQIAEALYSRQQRPVERIAWADLTGWVQSVYLDMADAVLALIQNGADR